jgi:hypothetical protein
MGFFGDIGLGTGMQAGKARLDAFERAKERQRQHTQYLKGALTCGTCGRWMLYSMVKNGAGKDFGYYCAAATRRRYGLRGACP